MKVAFAVLLVGTGLHAASHAASTPKDVPTTTVVNYMSTKSNAAAVQSWALTENGHVAHRYNLVAGQRYDLTLNAYGTPMNGVYPELQVFANNVLVKTIAVDSASLKAYKFTYDATVTGAHSIKVAYVNDAHDENEDRNVYLHSLSIDKWSCAVNAQLVEFQDFESPTLPNANGWGFGAQEGGKVVISTDRSQNFRGSAGSIRGMYPVAPGGMYVWGGFDISHLKSSEVYIDFWAKMPNVKQGFKFLKIFGTRTDTAAGNGYANTTFGLPYASKGAMEQISYGDGSTIVNDSQNVINLDGTYPSWIGRSFGTAVVSTPQNANWSGSNWGSEWHHFKMRVKFNSGTSAADQKADGAYSLEIDDKLYAQASGIYNRHYSNGPIEKVSIFDWAQGGTQPFEIWYDDIKITTGGFSSCSE